MDAVKTSGEPSPSTSATTGAPFDPAPTSGSSSVWTMYTLTGQPGWYALSPRFGTRSAAGCAVPSGKTTYVLVLPGFTAAATSCGVGSRTAERFGGSSYSSLALTT